jgi:hypothetical protein
MARKMGRISHLNAAQIASMTPFRSSDGHCQAASCDVLNGLAHNEREEGIMQDDFLAERRRTLEESFFNKQNEALRLKLREQESSRVKKEALAEASGISDETTLERLLALRISNETLAALYLVPLIEVAWADARIEEKERKALLKAAEEAGLRRGNASYELLEGWLSHRPDPSLLEAWKQYIVLLTETMEPEAKQTLRRDLVSRAQSVAEAAGGFLGLGSKVSSAEKAVLDELEKAFA